MWSHPVTLGNLGNRTLADWQAGIDKDIYTELLELHCELINAIPTLGLTVRHPGSPIATGY